MADWGPEPLDVSCRQGSFEGDSGLRPGMWAGFSRRCPAPRSKQGYPPALSLPVFFILPGVPPFMHSLRFTHAFIHSSIHAFTHSSIHAFTHSSIHAFIHRFTSHIHSPIHSCNHSVSHPTFAECPWWVRHRLNLEIP